MIKILGVQLTKTGVLPPIIRTGGILTWPFSNEFGGSARDYFHHVICYISATWQKPMVAKPYSFFVIKQTVTDNEYE